MDARIRQGHPSREGTRTYQGRLTLQQLAWPEHLRELPALVTEVADTADVAMLSKWVGTKTIAFALEDYRDTRKARIVALLEAADGVTAAATEEKVPVAAGAGSSMMTALATELAEAKAAATKAKRAAARAAKKTAA